MDWEINFFTQNIAMFDWSDTQTYVVVFWIMGYILEHNSFILVDGGYTGWFFLTGPPQFQYQKENCQAANQGLS